MDKSWIYLAQRACLRYVNGLKSFLNFAFEKSSQDGKILCPCISCHNRFYLIREEVYDHLICSGFKKEYSVWIYHGEIREDASSSKMPNEEGRNDQHDMYELLNDLFPTVPMEESGLDVGDSDVETDFNMHPTMQSDKNKADDLLEDIEHKVYPNSRHNKLSCLVHLYHIKCLNRWSNKSFSMLLKFLKDLLPEGNILPKKADEVKKIMAKLGLGYEKIDACPNGCMLFWKDTLFEQVCSICGASRWKPVQNNLEAEDASSQQQKKKAINILRWFPLKPRLQRLFMSSRTTELMKWHHLERVRDGKLRHPADAFAWKDFDEKYPDFASDPRNVRLALSNDGFNPYSFFFHFDSETIPKASASKKVRGHTKKQAIWDLESNERVVVNFDETSQPIGDEAKDFTRFLGTLVRMPQHVGIDVGDWRKIPYDKKEDLWNIVKEKFAFAPVETEEIKNWVMYDMGMKWKTWKYDLKRNSYDPSLSVDEIVTAQTDSRVDKTQFKTLVSSWFTEKTQEESEKNKMIRSKSKEPHITGTKSFARIIHEEKLKNDGVRP